MARLFYFTRETRFRLIVGTLICFYFLPFLWFLLLAIFLGCYLGLFYKKQIDFTERRLIEDNIILCPVTGELKGIATDEEKTVLSIKVGLTSDYGIYMPFYGEVEGADDPTESLEWQLILKSEKIQFTKVNLNKSLVKSCVFVGPGDIASAGANLGYLRFGGTVDVEVPVNCEILVKPGDKLRSSQTILASI